MRTERPDGGRMDREREGGGRERLRESHRVLALGKRGVLKQRFDLRVRNAGRPAAGTPPHTLTHRQECRRTDVHAAGSPPASRPSKCNCSDKYEGSCVSSV